MNIRSLVWKELWQRPAPTLTAFLAVALGVSALVAVQSIATSSEAKVAGQMQQLGANILVLPERVSLQNYYAADMHGETLPEEYVTRIALAQAVGVEELVPKLCVTGKYFGEPLVITGVLPRTEFQKKSAWQSVDLMASELDISPVGTEHEGCSGRVCQLSSEEAKDINSYAKTRVVHELAAEDVLVGSEVARKYHIRQGDAFQSLGHTFQVTGILPPTGTVDDDRVLAHLHTVQDLTDSGAVVNVIEVMGCCEDAANGLVGELETLLPDTRVVTISQIVAAQVTVNRLMNRMSYVLFGVMMLVGGASIASVMFANVSERRRELGTLMALGATPGMISRMIVMKASTIGIAGGVCGLLLGLIGAMIAGPWALDVSVSLSLTAALVGTLAAIGVTLIAASLPARRAAHLDPCVCFQET